MKKHIAILKGDGIGPEIVNETVKVLQAVAKQFEHEFEFTEALMGGVAIDATGNPLPDETIEICKAADAVLLGAIGDPKYDSNPDAKVRPEQGLLKIRKELALWANVRPIKIYEQLKSRSPLKPERLQDVDMVIYRELTGGIYFGEKKSDGNTASDLCLYHDFEIERIARKAFEAARLRRKKMCLVDKANVLESSRLWRKTVQTLAKEYSDVELNFMFIDNAAMQMILNPSQFDVILTSNMFGDILSDEASVLSGSIGLMPSSSLGETHKLYEPVHGSYPQAAGKNIANPMATILSAEMMLIDFGMIAEAELIAKAVAKCITEKKLSEDIERDAPLKCSEVGAAVCAAISELGPNAA